MAQSRERIFIVLIRKDVCSSTFACELGELINNVLPYAMYPYRPQSTRETVQDIHAYTSRVLNTLELEPTLPVPSQDCQNPNLRSILGESSFNSRGILGKLSGCWRLFTNRSPILKMIRNYFLFPQKLFSNFDSVQFISCSSSQWGWAA